MTQTAAQTMPETMPAFDLSTQPPTIPARAEIQAPFEAAIIAKIDEVLMARGLEVTDANRRRVLRASAPSYVATLQVLKFNPDPLDIGAELARAAQDVVKCTYTGIPVEGIRRLQRTYGIFRDAVRSRMKGATPVATVGDVFPHLAADGEDEDGEDFS